MVWKSKPTRFNLKLVRAMRKALPLGDDLGMGTVRHRLSVSPPEGGPPRSYTVYLTCDDHGTYMALCCELPEVTAFAEDEGEVLRMTRQAVQEALAAREHRASTPS